MSVDVLCTMWVLCIVCGCNVYTTLLHVIIISMGMVTKWLSFQHGIFPPVHYQSGQ